MIRVRFVGSDEGVGRLYAGESYFPGDEADLSDYEARIAINTGRAVPVVAAPSRQEPLAGAVAEHRDRPVRRRK